MLLEREKSVSVWLELIRCDPLTQSLTHRIISVGKVSSYSLPLPLKASLCGGFHHDECLLGQLMDGRRGQMPWWTVWEGELLAF